MAGKVAVLRKMFADSRNLGIVGDGGAAVSSSDSRFECTDRV